MSQVIQIAAGERRVVRVFQLDLPTEQIRFLRNEPAAIADLLGTDALNFAHVDLIRIAELDELGLSGYLIDGCDVTEAEIASDKARLDTLGGHVLILLSRAFDGQARSLTPKVGMSLIATYGQAATDWSAPQKITSASALPHSAPRVAPRKSRADARRIGGTVFAVFMVAIGLITWAVLT